MQRESTFSFFCSSKDETESLERRNGNLTSLWKLVVPKLMDGPKGSRSWSWSEELFFSGDFLFLLYCEGRRNLVDLMVIVAKVCPTMSTQAHPETRRFTRGLGKPGTAAELRQSVSEVVRTSVVVVSTHLFSAQPTLLNLCRPVRGFWLPLANSLKVNLLFQLIEETYMTFRPTWQLQKVFFFHSFFLISAIL